MKAVKAPATSKDCLPCIHHGDTEYTEMHGERYHKETLGFSEIWRGGMTDAVTSWINMCH